jgi:hypothetical protein
MRKSYDVDENRQVGQKPDSVQTMTDKVARELGGTKKKPRTPTLAAYSLSDD